MWLSSITTCCRKGFPVGLCMECMNISKHLQTSALPKSKVKSFTTVWLVHLPNHFYSRKLIYLPNFLLHFLFNSTKLSGTSQMHTDIMWASHSLKNACQVNEPFLPSVHPVVFEACYNTLSVFPSILSRIN